MQSYDIHIVLLAYMLTKSTKYTYNKNRGTGNNPRKAPDATFFPYREKLYLGGGENLFLSFISK